MEATAEANGAGELLLTPGRAGETPRNWWGVPTGVERPLRFRRICSSSRSDFNSHCWSRCCRLAWWSATCASVRSVSFWANVSSVPVSCSAWRSAVRRTDLNSFCSVRTFVSSSTHRLRWSSRSWKSWSRSFWPEARPISTRLWSARPGASSRRFRFWISTSFALRASISCTCSTCTFIASCRTTSSSWLSSASRFSSSERRSRSASSCRRKVSSSLRSPVPSSTFLLLTDAALPNGELSIGEDCAPALDRQLSHSSLRSFIAVRLAFRCLWDCNQVSIVPPGVLVATVLATEPIRGIAEVDLQRQVEAIREEVEVRGGLVAPLEHGLSEAIEQVVIKVLGMEKQNHQLVKRHKNFIMLSLWTPPEQLELSMMRNQLIHVFVLEGFVCVSMYAAEKSVFPCCVRREALRQSCTFLMHLFKREFIYKPSHYGDPYTFDAIIDFMVERRILTKQGDDLTVNDSPGTSTVAGENQGPTTYLFLCGLLWPFIESYWLAAICLRRILGGRLITLQTFVRQIQVVGERLFFESHIDLFEAIASSTLQNALLLFVDWGVLERVQVLGAAIFKSDKTLLRLAEGYDNEAALDALTDKIVKFRKKCRAYRSRRYQQRMGSDMDCGSSIVRTLSLSELPEG
eukprot:GGOE01042721.1.p1 GENE.GGOE01042721.1~~GGOE01042721.1.p1  ORF type:complete len:631 (-),score=183.11 GGOE01042721.1:202-2094(-)